MRAIISSIKSFYTNRSFTSTCHSFFSSSNRVIMRVSCQFVTIVALLASNSQGVPLDLPASAVHTNVGTGATNLGATTNGAATNLATSTNGLTTVESTTHGLTSKLGSTVSGVTHKVHSVKPSARVSQSLFGRAPHTIPHITSDGPHSSLLDSIFSGLKLKVEKRGLASPFGVFQNFAGNVPGAAAVSSLPMAGSVLPAAGSLMSNNPMANAIPSFNPIPFANKVPLSSLPLADASAFRGIPGIFGKRDSEEA